MKKNADRIILLTPWRYSRRFEQHNALAHATLTRHALQFSLLRSRDIDRAPAIARRA
jgi:hypothetical protein